MREEKLKMENKLKVIQLVIVLYGLINSVATYILTEKVITALYPLFCAWMGGYFVYVYLNKKKMFVAPGRILYPDLIKDIPMRKAYCVIGAVAFIFSFVSIFLLKE